MKKSVKIVMSLCMLFALSACSTSQKHEQSSSSNLANGIQDLDKDVVVKDEEKEKDEEKKDEEETVKPEEKPVNQEVKPTPEVKPEEKPEAKPEETPTVIDVKELVNQMKATDLFRMSADLDATQISDLYNGLSSDEYSEAYVFKNQLSPGGDEVAIFKANAGKMDTVLAGIKVRDDYGKNEGAFYPLEQEMFENSMTLQYGEYVVYIAARNADELAALANAMFIK